MDDAEFARICALEAFPRGHDALSVDEEAFALIKRQQRHRQLRAALRLHRNDKALRRYAARRAAGESLRAIAAAVDFSPCMLARLELESEYGWSKTAVSNVFKEAMADAPEGERNCRGLAPDEYARVLREVKECIEEDPYCSPLADRVRHNVGVEYEYRLLETLRNRRLVFESEDMLREKGLSKTPDVRLLLPIGVTDPATGELRVVNWIDSKAMFGDRHTHETENASQLQGYVNRYGPGMVIYWFGHITNLSTDSDVFITDRFPSEITLPGGFELSEAHVEPIEGDDAPLVELEAETDFDTQWTPITTAFLSL